MATLLFSQGTPMLLAGDEFGHSQKGDNNAYAQAKEITWLNWEAVADSGRAIREFVRKLIATRKAAAAEAALMVPAAFAHCRDYSNLRMPVSIVAGTDDRLMDSNAQSQRLHRDVPQSELHLLSGEGHMIQQTATLSLMAAINAAAGSANK